MNCLAKLIFKEWRYLILRITQFILFWNIFAVMFLYKEWTRLGVFFLYCILKIEEPDFFLHIFWSDFWKNRFLYLLICCGQICYTSKERNSLIKIFKTRRMKQIRGSLNLKNDYKNRTYISNMLQTTESN